MVRSLEIADMRKGMVKSEFERYFFYWIENRKFLDVLQKNDLMNRLCNRAICLGFEFFNNELYRVKMKDDVAKKRQILFIWGGFFSIMIDWYLEGCKESPQEMADMCCKFLYTPAFDFN